MIDHIRNTGRCWRARAVASKPVPAARAARRGARQNALPHARWRTGSGAPKANQNARKHGLFPRDAIAERRRIQALLVKREVAGRDEVIGFRNERATLHESEWINGPIKGLTTTHPPPKGPCLWNILTFLHL